MSLLFLTHLSLRASTMMAPLELDHSGLQARLRARLRSVDSVVLLRRLSMKSTIPSLATPSCCTLNCSDDAGKVPAGDGRCDPCQNLRGATSRALQAHTAHS